MAMYCVAVCGNCRRLIIYMIAGKRGLKIEEKHSTQLVDHKY